MKVTVNIETNNPADLILIGRALSGGFEAPEAAPVAAAAPRAARRSEPAVAQVIPATAQVVPATAQVIQEAAPAAPTQEEIRAALNKAVEFAGVRGTEKVKAFIAADYGVGLSAIYAGPPELRARFTADLHAIVGGTKPLPALPAAA